MGLLLRCHVNSVGPAVADSTASSYGGVTEGVDAAADEPVDAVQSGGHKNVEQNRQQPLAGLVFSPPNR